MGRKGVCALACGALLLTMSGAAFASQARPQSFPVQRVARVLAGMIAHDAARHAGFVAKHCCGVRVVHAKYAVELSGSGAHASYVLLVQTKRGAIESVSVSALVSQSIATGDGGIRESSESFEFALHHSPTRAHPWGASLASGGFSSTSSPGPGPRQGLAWSRECGGPRSVVSRGLYEAVLGVVLSAKLRRLDVPALSPLSDCAAPRTHS